MDAKPQRPPRQIRVRDENVPPQAVMGKTIHSRNKSTSALTTLSQTGVNKPTAKRTVFADVSNTARAAGVQVKDDINISSKVKAAALAPSLAASIQQLTKSSANFLRPAQRPLSQAPIKATSYTSSSGVTAVAVSKPATNTTVDVIHPPAKKPLSRKSTAIFKEVEQPLNDVKVETVPVKHEAPVQKPSRIELQEVIAKGLVPLPKEPVSSEVSLKDEAKQPKISTETILTESLASALNAAKSTSIASSTQIDTYEPLLPALPAEPADEYHAALDVQAGYAYLESLDSKAQVVEHEREFEHKSKSSVLPADEPVEYWPVEDDEEYYDADGYTTTRSLRSRGDNTTGPVTLVICPRVTTRVQEELAAAKMFVESTKSLDDIEDECWDTTMVAEYGDDIFDYMRTLEDRLRPNPYYMENQVEIQWSMRSVLMDWLVQVHHRFNLLPETLFLSVNYVDRFLSCKIVSLGKLQLVGATAIFVAAKYEEINCPSVQEIEYMVDGGYTTDEILKAERFMLSMLQFDLGWPGPMSFLRRVSKADDYDLETRTLAKYFLEVTIMDERFVGCAPSFTAAASHCLARMLLRKGDWSPAHVYYSNYTYAQIRQLAAVILDCCDNPLKHHAAVYEKYVDSRYRRASLFVEAELQHGFQLPPLPRESAGSVHSWRRK